MSVDVTVFWGEKGDGEWPSENAELFIEWFRDKLNSVPVELRAGAEVEIGCDDAYRPFINITYRRPETDNEAEAKIKSAAANAGRLKRYELKLLQELKDKYEG